MVPFREANHRNSIFWSDAVLELLLRPVEVPVPLLCRRFLKLLAVATAACNQNRREVISQQAARSDPQEVNSGRDQTIARPRFIGISIFTHTGVKRTTSHSTSFAHNVPRYLHRLWCSVSAASAPTSNFI
ncbi:hypothetical protein RvY_19144 [Ramazzottius varieornatus]|uniref:Uncharacterized protein n=1 Tax=Ramazzottius varieornatus TaxID=947166 RepID=A0A1D1W8E3_RAMVA|nr:hypothetical protein RvY_19144 [Ramazzottius varieornatus]